MIAVDELQFAWYLSRLMDDYAALSELYAIHDDSRVERPGDEVFRRSVMREVEAYRARAKRHQSELDEFLCAAAEITDEQQAFEEWAADNLGQGYPLAMDEGTYENAVTRWAFIAWKAGRRQLRESND